MTPTPIQAKFIAAMRDAIAKDAELFEFARAKAAGLTTALQELDRILTRNKYSTDDELPPYIRLLVGAATILSAEKPNCPVCGRGIHYRVVGFNNQLDRGVEFIHAGECPEHGTHYIFYNSNILPRL